MAGQTMFDKIWQQHVVSDLGEGWALLHIDRHLLHDLSGGRALQALEARGLSVRNPELAFATPDHAVSSAPGRTADSFAPGAVLHHGLQTRSRANRIAFFDLGQDGQGIVHVMAPELGIVLPGVTLICGDSHTCTNGALGAQAFGAISNPSLRGLLSARVGADRQGELQGGLSSVEGLTAIVSPVLAAVVFDLAVQWGGAPGRARRSWWGR